MSQELHENLIWNIIVVHNSLLFFCEVMGERGFKVGGSGGQYYLMAVNWFAIDHQRDITEVFLVQDA